MKNRLISFISSFIFAFTACLLHAETDEKTSSPFVVFVAEKKT